MLKVKQQVLKDNNQTKVVRKWTEKDYNNLIKLYGNSVDIKIIAEQLDRTVESIKHKIKDLKKDGKLNNEDKNQSIGIIQKDLEKKELIEKKINKSTKNKIIKEVDEKEIKINKSTKNKKIDNCVKKECKCDFDSQIGYLIEKLGDEPINKITIKEYLENKDIKKQIASNKKYLVCQKGEELIKYESDIIKNHFKHKNCVHIYEEMSEWHKNWQNEFELVEVEIGNRRADAVVENKVLEFQHSQISKDLVNDRNENYKKHDKELYWIIDGNGSVEIENKDNRYIIKFINSIWKYDSFIKNEYVFLDYDNKIYKIKPNLVKSNMIDVKEFKTKLEFIDSIKNNKNIWSNDELEQCILYHNQRGAGCGKTYESIQLLQNKFKDKTTFIYLTKMHSAKEVIYNELKEQYERGNLDKLDIPKEAYDINSDSKQYKICFYNKETEKDCTIIIGTIDSFMFAVGENKNSGNDFFKEIVKNIRDGQVKTSKSGNIKYAKENIKLNKLCLVVIDEAQDLGPIYIEAIDKIMKKTSIDTYVIGDKLQSIWGEQNIHTFLESNNLPNVKIKRDNGVNHVMRFHNEQFKTFVNKIIDYKKYNLPEIDKICINSNCKYKHENNIKPYTLFEMPSIYSNDSDEIKVNKLVEKIIGYVDTEVNKYNYLPNNFMFIFPVLSKNYLANRLELRLQDYWITKFNNEEYKNNVVKKNKYWKNKNNNDFTEYVKLHKSDEGKSINLQESEHATRLLSIHASKGNGCEVVFLLGLSEKILRIYSKEKCNLMYESLLHVAITRQKKSLYIGFEKKNDDICKRLIEFGFEKDETIKPPIDNITSFRPYENLVSYCYNDEKIFSKIQKSIIKDINYESLKIENNDKKNIIDWGHHVVRYAVFYYNILFNIINNEKIDNEVDIKTINFEPDQIKTLLSKISELTIISYNYSEYYNTLKIMNSNSSKNKKDKNVVFPILMFDFNEKSEYFKYNKLLCNIIKHVQLKVSTQLKKNKIPYLCPLESLILLHMIDIYDHGIYADIVIMNVYSVMYYFDQCSNSINETHNNCNCICKNIFKDGNFNPDFNKYLEIRNSIVNHYDKTNQVEVLYNNYKKVIIKKYNEDFKYNIQHYLGFWKNNKNFTIGKWSKIIGYSDNYVINIIISTQLNKINFYEVIFDCIFDNYLILNQKIGSKNYDKYANKKIVSCIFSLDSTDPIFYEFDIDKENALIDDFIKSFLIKEYEYVNEIVYDFYKYCKMQKPKGFITSVYDELITNNKIPNYIPNYFYDIKNEIIKNKDRKDDIIKQQDDKELFLKNIKLHLEKDVDSFLGKINEDEDI